MSAATCFPDCATIEVRRCPMRGEIITITTDGSVYRRPTATTENLSALNAAVGGMVSTAPRFTSFDGSPCRAYVNYNRLSLGLPENRAAMRLLRKQVSRGPGKAAAIPRLHGPVAIVTGDAEFMAAVQAEEF